MLAAVFSVIVVMAVIERQRRGLKMLWCFLLLAIATFIVGLSSMQG